MVRRIAIPKRGGEGETKAEIIKCMIENKTPLATSIIFKNVKEAMDNEYGITLRSTKALIKHLTNLKNCGLLRYISEEKKYELPHKCISKKYLSKIYQNILKEKIERLSLLFFDEDKKRAENTLYLILQWNKLVYEYRYDMNERLISGWKKMNYRSEQFEYILSSLIEYYQQLSGAIAVSKNMQKFSGIDNSSLVIGLEQQSEQIRGGLEHIILASNKFIERETLSRERMGRIKSLIQIAENLVKTGSVFYSGSILSRDGFKHPFVPATPSSQHQASE